MVSLRNWLPTSVWCGGLRFNNFAFNSFAFKNFAFNDLLKQSNSGAGFGESDGSRLLHEVIEDRGCRNGNGGSGQASQGECAHRLPPNPQRF
jgi:hypothetical protein